MATMTNDKSTSQQGSGRGMQGSTGEVGSPVSNEAYNVITALQAKLEGLEAYRKYTRDGSAQIWQQLMPIEMQAVDLLIGQLEQLVKNGTLRRTSGGDGH